MLSSFFALTMWRADTDANLSALSHKQRIACKIGLLGEESDILVCYDGSIEIITFHCKSIVWWLLALFQMLNMLE
jgi:hypothetical protein